MAKYSGSGWHSQSERHANARRTGHAGGKYADRFYSVKGFPHLVVSKITETSNETPRKDISYVRVISADKDATGRKIKYGEQFQEKTRNLKLLSQEEAMKRTLLRDSDGDGVPDKYDCQPHNPKKQDTKAQKEGKEPIDWWMGHIPKEEINFRIEEAKERGETLSEEDAEKQIWEDTGYWEDEWQGVIDRLGELMKQKTKGLSNDDYWKVDVKNFGWRNQDGEAIIRTTDPAELLRKTLPQTDNHFKIFNDGKRGLKIQNYHHDSPTGNEWYTLRPMTAKEIKNMMENKYG